MSAEKTAITPTRAQDFPEWYQQVIKAADLAENSETRGCMVIKPWGYGIWELIQQQLDRRFKATGHQNAYFPLLIPLSYLEEEGGGLVNILSGVGLAAALVVLAFQLMTANVWISAEDAEKVGDWTQLLSL